VRDLARIFQALSDVNRIRILKMLEKRSLCVCEITAILKLATSTVSKHLSILRNAGFVTDAKEGKWINYSLIESPSSPYIDQLLPLFADIFLPIIFRRLANYENHESPGASIICQGF